MRDCSLTNYVRQPIKGKVLTYGGEFMRELALLVVVFFPLDVYVQYRTLTTLQALTTFVTCLVLWTIGVPLDVVAADD